MTDLPIFPLAPLTNPGFSVHRRPTFHSILLSSKRNNRETATYQEPAPFWEFELRYDVLRDKTLNSVPDTTNVGNYLEFNTLAGFFFFVSGQYAEFYFDDWTDNSRTKQLIGIGDDATTEFKLLRTIEGVGGLTFTEAVGGANLNHSVVVYIDNVAQDPLDWTISDDLLYLVFTTPPAFGLNITITYYYYYRCRFVSERQEFEEFFTNRWSVNSLKFHNVPDGSINPLNPIVSPIPPLTAACLDDFLWYNSSINVSAFDLDARTGLDSKDVFGNIYFWPTTEKSKVYLGDGSGVVEYSQIDLADMIDAWYALGPIVERGGSAPPSATEGFVMRPIYNGQYVLACMGGTSLPPPRNVYAFWWALLEPHADGSLNCVGAFYYAGIFGPPFQGAFGFNILGIAGEQTDTDPLLFYGFTGFGGSDGIIGVLPSISEFLAGIYKLLIPPCLGPNTILYPISSTNLGRFLFSSNPLNRCRFSGMLLPGSSGNTIFYMYISRQYMDYQAGFVGAGSNPEIRTVIQPSNPFGCMIKIDLGVLNYATLSTTPYSGSYFGSTTGIYSIDNASWLAADGVTSILPFRDEYTYISNGALGGQDAYSMLPIGIDKRLSGKFWVYFYMGGVEDSINRSNVNIYGNVRVIEYDPATETAIQIVKASCIIHDIIQIPVSPSVRQYFDYYQSLTMIESGGDATMRLTGMVYQVDFASFTVP